MQPISRRAWLQYVSVFALLAVLGTFALWYAWYVRDRREALVARNLRLVEAMGLHVAQSLTATRRALDKIIEDGASGELEKNVDPPDAPPVARLRALFRDRSVTGIQDAPAPGEQKAQGPPPKRIKMSTRPPSMLELRTDWPPPGGISVKIDLGLLLKRERANDADGQPVFEDVVLSLGDGQVIAQRDAPAGQLFWLPAPPADHKKGFERVGTFEALKEHFYLFRQVITVEDLEITVSGMVSFHRFEEVARWLSSSKQLLLGLAVLLATLALPFLRVHFDPDRSVPVRDFAFVGVAGIAAVSVLTLVIIDLPMYESQLRAKTDDELRGLLVELRGRFLQELDDVGDALAGVSPDVLVPDERSKGDLFSQGGFATLKDRYPFLSEVSLIDRHDRQITKWSRDWFASPLRYAGDRAFVRDFRNGLAWTIDGRALIAQHLRSRSKGVKETVVCIRQPEGGRGGRSSAGAAGPPDNLLTATAEMLSVNAPILPRGYEFALFDRDGDVMYHSMTERSIDENILEEVAEPRPFRFMTVPEPFDTLYRGRAYRAALVRVGSTDLTLAVMRDMTHLQAFNRWFIERTAIAGLSVFGLEFVALVIIWRASRGDRRWCFPHPCRLGRTVSALALITALVGVVVAARQVVPAQALWVSVAAALGGIFWTWYLLARFPHAAVERRLDAGLARIFTAGTIGEAAKVTHVGLVTMFLVLIGVLPTLAVTELTFRWSMEQEVEKEAIHLQREWRTRERNIVEGYGRSAPWLVDRRRGEQTDRYRSRTFDTEILAACPRGPASEVGLNATAPFLSTVDALARVLGGRGRSALPADRWHGSFRHVVICAPRESDIDIDVAVEPFVAKAEVSPEMGLWGWRRWTMIVIALFLGCWWAVGLLQSRVVMPGGAPGAAPAPRDDVPPAPALAAGPADAASAPRPAPLASTRGSPQHWRWVFALMLLAASVFIYLTQQIGTLAFVTGLASILPVVMRLADTFHAVGRGERPSE